MNFKFILMLSGLLIFNACEDGNRFNLDYKTPADELKLYDDLSLEITSAKNKTIDSVAYAFQDVNDVTSGGKITIPLEEVLLGKHTLKLKVYAEGDTYDLTENLRILNNKPPRIFKFEVINAFPHDIKAYTQGLEFYKDSLYESIGHYGESALRKVELESGEVLKEHKMKPHYFGEGITIIEDKIYQLTWREGEGLIYDVNTFEVLDKFRYDKSEEGWGLCHDEDYVYKSDGTDKIWRLDKNTLQEIDYIQPATHQSVSEKLNELEYVEGKIYANTYGKDGVAVINPKNGAIEAVIDFRKLKLQVKQHKDLDVLNGIAYHPGTKKLYVTGKNWNKLFEVKVISK